MSNDMGLQILTWISILDHMILPIISELSGLLRKGETEASGAMIDSIPLSFFRVKEAINGENTAKNGNHICCWLLSFFCFRVETFWEYDQTILTFDQNILSHFGHF